MNKYLLVLFLLLNYNRFTNIINGQTLSSSEFTCIDTLSNAIVPNETIPIDFGGIKDYCSAQGIKCNSNTLDTIALTQTSTSAITPSLFNCFSQVSTISINNVNTPFQDLITFKYGNSLFKKLFLTTKSSTFSISTPSSMFYVELSADQHITPTTISFSYLSNLSFFYYYVTKSSLSSSTLFQVTYNNDLTTVWKASELVITSTSFPSFKNINSSSVQLELMPNSDMTSINNNIGTIGNISSFLLTSLKPYNNIFQFPSNINSIKSPSILSTLNLNCPFVTPTSIIDIQSLSATSLLISTSRNFHLNGALPLILSSSLKSFTFTGGYIKQLDYSKFNSISTLYLSENGMDGTLPSMSSNQNLKNVYLANNNITGTVDRSYCKLEFISFYNNKLSGEIPTCFTCFYTLYKPFFQSNLFTNFENPLKCTTILPNSLSFTLQGDTYTFSIRGYDLGPSSVGQFVQISGNNILVDSNSIKGVVPSSQLDFNATLIDVNLGLPETIKITFNAYLNQLSFIMAVSKKSPKTVSVDWFGNDLVFSGSFYSYNTSDITISIGGQSCIVQQASFNTINCSVSLIDNNLSNIKTIIKVGSYSSQISLNPDSVSTIIDCPTPCNSNSYCNTDNGQCICENGWQGTDCSIKFIQCQKATDNGLLCGGRGTCFNQTGICLCEDTENNSPSCSLCSDPLCGGNGKCNYLTTTCQCNQGAFGYQGQNCTIPSIYVSRIEPSLEEGGTSIFSGWFGLNPFNSQIKVYINSKECSIISSNSTTIICNAPPGIGLVSVSLEHTLINWSKSSFYKYQPTNINCLNDCNSINGGGSCDNKSGYCLCNKNWDGLDCSIKLNDYGNGNNGPKTNTSVDNQTGIVNFNNQNTNYKISIISLLEIGYDGSVAKKTLLNNQWSNITVFKNQDDNLVYNFTSTIQKDSNNQSLSTITYLVEEVQKNKVFSFAGIQFKLSEGSVKITATISNYQFSSNLNTLKLLLESSVDNSLNNDKCNDPNVNINSINNVESAVGQSNTLNYISIKKDAKVLNGRFMDRIEVDEPGRYTYSTNEIYNKTDNSLVVAINLPHCSTFCKLDPDFSVILSSDFKPTCSSNRKWLLPVVIVIPVVVLSIIIVSIIILRRNRLSRLNIGIKLKSIINK